MTDEEKKAFESVKDMFEDVTIKDIDEQSITIYGVAMLDVIKVLTIIEKQEKEIEHQKEKRENQRKELAILNAKQIEFNKLVNTVNSYKGQFKKQQKEIEKLKEKIKTFKIEDENIYLQFGEITEKKRWKDKIKAKIEEYENKIKKIRSKKLINEPEDTIVITRYAHYISVLQSLLEKGK